MDEKKKILKMVEDGKITAQEALDLIEAIGTDKKKEEPKVKKNRGGKRMFRIRIDANDAGGKEKAKVNVNIPLSVAMKLTSLTKMIPDSAKAEMEKEGVDLDELNLKELLEAIASGDSDESLVDIDATNEDGTEGAKVKIYVD